MIARALIILACLANMAHAGTYYVSSSGTASWSSCTSTATPCSWQTAMANAVADDIVYFRGGTYNVEASCSGSWEYIAMTPAHSGSSGHPITFIAYPGEEPQVSPCSSSPISPAFGARDVDYIIYDGFTGSMLPSGGSGEVWYFVYWNSNHSIVRNMSLRGTYSGHGSMANCSPIRVEVSDYVEVYNNYLYDINAGGDLNNNAGIWLFGDSYNKIYNNTIIGSGGGETGIRMKVGPNSYAEMYNNFIRNCGDGIVISDEVASQGQSIYNNVIVNPGGKGIDLYTGTGVTVSNVQIYNNTVYGGDQCVEVSETARSAQVWNNICSGSGSPFVRLYGGDSMPSYLDYNDYYGSGTWYVGWSTSYETLSSWVGVAYSGSESHSVTSNPNFVSAGGTTPESYKRSSYPTDGRGGLYASVMGAYITGNETIGYTESGGATPQTGNCVFGSGNRLIQFGGSKTLTIR